jgi:hypothetical protein
MDSICFDRVLTFSELLSADHNPDMANGELRRYRGIVNRVIGEQEVKMVGCTEHKIYISFQRAAFKINNLFK